MALTQIGETRHTSRPETASENLQRLALVAGKDDKSTSQIIHCTRVDRDFSNGKLVLKREELMLQRRREREDQHYKQIWTKGAHGGPYRKCQTDHQPQKQVEPGYEKPQSGPTTNFVGNHMTQGAIDLVQMDLEERDPAADLRRLKDYCRRFRPPKLLQGVEQPLLTHGSQEANTAASTVARLDVGFGAREDKRMQESLRTNPASLRRALISQRGNKTAGDGLLFQPYLSIEGDVLSTACCNVPICNNRCTSATMHLSVEASRAAAHTSAEAGRYAEAVQLYTDALTAATHEVHEAKADCLLERAKCLSEIGFLKQAVQDCDSALGVLTAAKAMQPREMLSRAYRQRGQLHDQLEAWQSSAEDYKQSVALQPACQQFVQRKKALGGLLRRQTEPDCDHKRAESMLCADAKVCD